MSANSLAATGPDPVRPRLARWIEMIRLYSGQVVTRMRGNMGPGESGFKLRGAGSFLFRCRPAYDLVGGQRTIRFDPSVPERSSEHVAEVLRPGQERTVTDRIFGVTGGNLDTETTLKLVHQPHRNLGARRREDE